MLDSSLKALNIFGRNVRIIVIMENNMGFPLKFKFELFYDPACLCLGLHPNNMNQSDERIIVLTFTIASSIIFHSQGVETIQIPINMYVYNYLII